MKPYAILLLLIPLVSFGSTIHVSNGASEFNPNKNAPTMIRVERTVNDDQDPDKYEYFKLKRVRKNQGSPVRKNNGPLLHIHKLDEDLASKMASDKLVVPRSKKSHDKARLARNEGPPARKGPLLHTHKLDEDLASKMASDKLVGSHSKKRRDKASLARNEGKSAMKKAVKALLTN